MTVTINKQERDAVTTWLITWDTPDFTMFITCCDEQHANELAAQLKGAGVRQINVAPTWIGNLRVK